MAFVSPSRIECCAPGHDWACDLNKERQNVSTMSFIGEIRKTAPQLYSLSDFLMSHP
jgi:hypothetical protein